MLFIPANGVDDDKIEAYQLCAKEYDNQCLILFNDNVEELKKASIQKEVPCESVFPYSWYGNFLNILLEKKNYKTKGNCGKLVTCFYRNDMKKAEDLFVERQTELNFGVLK